MLNISDLNQVIKYYAYNLQQRIQELDRLSYHFNIDQDEPDPHYLQLLTVIEKYRGYTAREEREVKLARKLAERIVEIFDFFKGKSNNQNLLTMILQRIQTDLDSLLQQNPINLGDLFSFVHLVAKKGGLVRVPAEKRRIFSKTYLKEPGKTQPRIAPSLSFFNIQRRGTCTTSHKHQKVLSVVSDKPRLQDVLQGPWNCLDVEKGPLARIKESTEQQVLKDMLRRNERILNLMKKQQKRWKIVGTEVSEESGNRQSTILSEMKSNSIKGSWLCKKRRVGVAPRKKNMTLKQNISIII